MKINDMVNVEYKASVYVQAGWRSVYFKGIAKMISDKRCEITEITHIDDEPVKANMSRTGAKRQSFYGIGAAKKEIGSIKIISKLFSCELIS